MDHLIAQVRQALAGRHPDSSSGDAERSEQTDPTSDGGEAPPPLRLVTEADVLAAHAAGLKALPVVPGAIITPLAHDALRQHGIGVASVLPGRASRSAGAGHSPRAAPRGTRAVVATGVVPTARHLEAVISSGLRHAGMVARRVPSPVREGAHLARQVAGAVSGAQAEWGLIVDETGMVASAVANRVRGVRAAVCGTPLEARWARERLGANVLCVAGDLVAPTLMGEILEMWIATPAKLPPEIEGVLRELDR